VGGCEYDSGIEPADDHQGRHKGPSPSVTLVERDLAMVNEISCFRLTAVRTHRRGIG
jgi:hypothetical protein